MEWLFVVIPAVAGVVAGIYGRRLPAERRHAIGWPLVAIGIGILLLCGVLVFAT